MDRKKSKMTRTELENRIGKQKKQFKAQNELRGTN